VTSQGRRPGKPGGEERAAAALTGSGPSQLGVDASMRGRDVSRPRPEHEIDAERLVQVSYRPRSQPRPPLPGTPTSPREPRKQPGPPQPDGSAGGSPEAS
jgi:hypothetical protein